MKQHEKEKRLAFWSTAEQNSDAVNKDTWPAWEENRRGTKGLRDTEVTLVYLLGHRVGLVVERSLFARSTTTAAESAGDFFAKRSNRFSLPSPKKKGEIRCPYH